MKSNSSKSLLRSYIVSTISIALVLFVMGSIGYAITSIFSSAKGVREGVVMLVELDNNIEEPARDSLQLVLAADSLVSSIKFVSKADKMADTQFRRAFDVDIEALLGENPLPDSFDITLSTYAADTTAMAAFTNRLKALSGISHISYPENMLKEVHTVLDTMQLLLLLFGGAMLAISIVLLNNTLRLTIFARREAIKTMSLVGATKWFILKPFLTRSALQGAISGIVASALLFSALLGIDHTLPQLGIMGQVELAAIISAAMVAAGVAIAMLFTIIAVNKFVNMRSNNIYMY